MPGGRPTKYQLEFCQRAVEFMSEGFSKEAFAGELGVCKQTIYNWMEEHSEFLDAIRKGEEGCRLWWEKLGRAGAAGKVVNFNATAWVFNMKNRHGWSDKMEQTTNMNVTGRVQTYLPDNGKTEPDGD